MQSQQNQQLEKLASKLQSVYRIGFRGRTMNPQNETPTTELNQQPEQVVVNKAPELSRRKFIMTAGVSSLPVIMSLKSGDAWGCIGLDCAPGTGNLSGTRSAVLSAQTVHKKNYIVPKWDKISNIQKVVAVDFGRNIRLDGTRYHGFLLHHYDFAYTYNASTKKYDLIKTANARPNVWVRAAQSALNQGNLFILKNNQYQRFSEWTDPKTNRKFGLIQPASYNNQILTGQTNLGQFFPNITRLQGVTISSALTSTDVFVKFFTAAFIGSIWEAHPIWLTGYPGAVKNTQCYPKTHELLAALKNVTDRNAKAHPRGLNGALDDMGRLFEMYTIRG